MDSVVDTEFVERTGCIRHCNAHVVPHQAITGQNGLVFKARVYLWIMRHGSTEQGMNLYSLMSPRLRQA